MFIVSLLIFFRCAFNNENNHPFVAIFVFFFCTYFIYIILHIYNVFIKKIKNMKTKNEIYKKWI
jgi:hypothetical protein